MNPERWRKIKEVFQDAWVLSPEDRPAYLRQACGADSELLAEVEELLRYECSNAGLLSKRLHEIAGHLIPLSAQPAVGHRVGAYRLVREIGRGGMGTVYEAVRDDEQFQYRVAIKLLKGEIGGDSFAGRFLQERQILAVLNHSNIAKLLDGGITEEGQPFFVMEYVDGLPIDGYCRTKRLSITQRLRLFQQVCSAVQYAHQNLVVHRDLKPSNILVTGDGTVKLLDFGIAKLLQPDGPRESAPVTRTTQLLMTPEYASPERVRGWTVTTATDIYSLGVILYELLTGSPPYRLKSRLGHELGRIVCEEEPAKPSATIIDKAVTETGERSAERLRRRLSGDLDNIVLMALRKEPHRRYPSVDKFVDDIERHLNQLPVAARRDTWSYRAAKFLRRNRISAGAASVVALSLIAGVIATTWQAKIAERNLRDAVGRQLAAQSERLLAGGDPSLATLLAVEASRHLTSLETDQALRHALRVLPRNKVIARRNTKIRSMAISPDGHWLAEAGEDGVLAIHDARSGELTLTEKLGAAADALAFDSASRHLGVACADGSVLILNMTQPSARISKKYEGAATAIAFDPSGTVAVIATAKTKVVLARSADLTEQKRLDAGGIVPAEALAFSPDGKWIAAGSGDGYLYVWEARSGKEHLRLVVAASGEPEKIGVNAVQFSADSKNVAVAGNGGSAILFDVASGRPLTTVKHDAMVSSVAISPDGRYLGTGSIDETARIWELPPGRLVALIRQNAPVSRVMFSLDGRFMITAGRDGTARSLAVPAGRELARVSHLDRVSAIAYDALNARFASAGWDGSVILAEPEAREEVGRLIHQSVIFDVHVSGDGKWLAAASDDKTVSVWSFDSRRQVRRLSLPVGCFALDFSPDSRWLAAGCGPMRGGSGILRVWSLGDWHEAASVSLPNAGLLTRFSPDGRWLAVGVGQAIGKGPGAAVVVSTDSWHTVAQLPYGESCYGVAFSANQQWLAAGCGRVGGGSPGEVSVYSTGKWQRVAQFPQKETVTAVTFSPNSRWLAMAGGQVRDGQGEALVWETGTWREAARLKHPFSVFAATFSADSKMLVTGSGTSFGDGRGETVLWQIPSGILIRKLPYARAVYNINFSPSGGLLATAGFDLNLRVWDSATGKQIAEMAQNDALLMAAYHPTGRYLASAGFDGTARVWMVHPTDLALEACSRLSRNMTKEERAAYLESEPYRKTCLNLP